MDQMENGSVFEMHSDEIMVTFIWTVSNLDGWILYEPADGNIDPTDRTKRNVSGIPTANNNKDVSAIIPDVDLRSAV